MAKRKQDTPLSSEAAQALRAARFSDHCLTLPEGHLACYGEIKALVESLGGRWVRQTGRLEFSPGVSARDMIMPCVEKGVIPATNPHDFFPTPASVIDLMFHDREDLMARVQIKRTLGEPVRFLEPNGGSGAIASRLAALMQPGDELVIVEINPLMAANLRHRFPQAMVIEGDFLAADVPGLFDVIAMNPPFNRRDYQLHYQRAFSLLARRGALCCVAPQGFIQDRDFLLEVLSRGTFSELGRDRFDGTAISISLIWTCNEASAKDEPHDGFSSYHAWHAHLCIVCDGYLNEQVRQSQSFAQFYSVLQAWADQIARRGSYQRMDKTIAREVAQALARDTEESLLSFPLAA